MRRAILLIVLGSVGCVEPPTALVDIEAAFAISDGGNGGNDHFFFLPPLGEDPTPNGPFDDGVSPIVEVCVWDGTCSGGPPIAVFSMSSGPGSETIRVDAASEHYIVNWDTKGAAASSDLVYRIRVLVEGIVVGFADVRLGANGGEAWELETDETIGAVGGRTIPIKFRIEEGVVPEFRTLYGVNSADDGLSVIDPESGQVTFIGRLHPNPDLYVTPVALAVRPSDGELFVWNNSNRDPVTGGSFLTGVLLTVDRVTGLASPVGSGASTGLSLGALAFSPDGRLFGMSSTLYEIDPVTGDATPVGPVGLRIGAADFDASGVLWGVELSMTTDRLVTIDTSTGTSTVIAELSPDSDRIGTIVFTPDGALLGTNFVGPLGSLFDIEPSTGATSNFREFSGGFMPQGLGFSR